jgi:hypothetical protein
MESGIDKHWDNLAKDFMPLIIRSFNVEFNPKSDAQVLSVENIKWSFFLLIIGCNFALVLIVIENLQKKFCAKINYILLKRFLKQFVCFTYNSLTHKFNLIVTKLKLFKNNND